MQSSKKCRFCNIIANNYNYANVDEPFFSNDEFAAIASIGALVEGWSLIIPKRHQLSMKSVYHSSQFQDIMLSITPKLIKRYGQLITFEHGANCEGSITSCGTDHAHLHIVPWADAPLIDFQNSTMEWIKVRASEISAESESNEYLFYSDLNNPNEWCDPIGYLHILKKPVSQFFRQLIAKKCGKSKEANYNEFPFLETARQTRNVLAISMM